MPRVNQKGYSLPIAIIILLALLALPAYFWLSSNTLNFSTSTNVRGVSDIGQVSLDPGFSVSLNSSAKTWDLVVYLCESRDECERSATSGYRFATISGGETEYKDLLVAYDSSWENYAYVKYYVRSGWYTQGSVFTVANLGDIDSSFERTLSDGRFTYNAVITPIDAISNAFYRSAHFSDK